MNGQNEPSLLIIGRLGNDAPDPGNARKSIGFSDPIPKLAVEQRVPVGVLRANFESTMNALRDAFAAVTQPIGNLAVESLEINLEVTADGKVGFLGTGTSVTGKAGVTLKLTRPSAKGA